MLLKRKYSFYRKSILNPQTFWHILRLIVILFFPLHFAGCTSLSPAMPNVPYAGNSYPTGLTELAQKNQLLVQELGKLPEMQDGISQGEAETLSLIVDIYTKEAEKFDYMLNKMLSIGKPEVRSYNAPLQAFYWLLEDGAVEEARFNLYNYDLIRLLTFSWKLVNHESLSKSKKRWSHFDTVVERLNSPELLDYYINKKMKYKKNSVNSHTPQNTFLHNWGDCDDLAVFGKYILLKAGYHVGLRYVHWTADNRGHVGLIILLEDGQYFIAVNFNVGNLMAGPYATITEVDKKLSLGTDYHDSGWWHQTR
jgi:hypothetical protein